MAGVNYEQEQLEGFPEIEYETSFRVMGRLVLTAIVNSLKELTEREMVGTEEIVERLRREGF